MTFVLLCLVVGLGWLAGGTSGTFHFFMSGPWSDPGDKMRRRLDGTRMLSAAVFILGLIALLVSIVG